VLSQGTLLTGLGIAIGLAISAASARALSAWLFGVAPLDPMTFAVVVVVTGAAGLLASAVPAWSAARVDPTIALRAE
jgi:putative ABC transport system permease protein